MANRFSKSARKLAGGLVLSGLLVGGPVAPGGGIARAEPIADIVEGAFYFQKGVLYDVKVKVIDRDFAKGRVKVYNFDTNQVEWASPGSLLNRTDSVARDMDRFEIGVRILDALMKPSPAETKPAVTKTPWRAGAAHPKHPHVLAAKERDKWVPAPGYEWVDPKKSWRTRWVPGAAHPTNPNRISGRKPGEWLDGRRYAYVTEDSSGHWVEKVDGVTFEPAPFTSGRLFKPDQINLYTDPKANETYIFHTGKVDYSTISHLEYQPDDHWVVVVMKDGRRLDLGQRILDLIRPNWEKAKIVGMVETKDKEVVDGKSFEMRHVARPAPPPRYVLGFQAQNLESFVYKGDRYLNGVRIVELMKGYPAEAAGLRAGDVLVKLDNQFVRDVPFVNAYLTEQNGAPVVAHYLRDGTLLKTAITPKRYKP